MANRYANLVGSNKIKDEYTKINAGFDAVQAEMDAVNAELDQKADLAFARVNGLSARTKDDTLNIAGGTGITVSENPNTKTITITSTGTATPGAHGSAHTEFGADPIPLATPTEGGLMSAVDKTKLDSLAISVVEKGADKTGATDSVAAIQDAFNEAQMAGGGIVFFPAGTYLIGSNITFPSNVTAQFSNGAKLLISNGVTVTFEGSISAGLHHIFDGNGVVSIKNADIVYPQWWGAKGNRDNDDTQAIQKAIDAIKPTAWDAVTQPKGGIVFLAPGTYRVTSPIILRAYVRLVGSGMFASELFLSNGTNDDVIKTDGYDSFVGSGKSWYDTSGVPTGFGIESLCVYGNRFNNTSGGGIKIYGYNYVIKDVAIVHPAGTAFTSRHETGNDTWVRNKTKMMETLIQNLHIYDGLARGFEYLGPSDAKIDGVYVGECRGDIGTLIQSSVDVGLLHTYACCETSGGTGVVIKGGARFDTLISEHNYGPGLFIDSWHVLINTLQLYRNCRTSGSYNASISVNSRYVQIGNCEIKLQDVDTGGLSISGERNKIGRVILVGDGVTTYTKTGVRFDSTAHYSSILDLHVEGLTGAGATGLALNQGGSADGVTVKGTIVNCSTCVNPGSQSNGGAKYELSAILSAGQNAVAFAFSPKATDYIMVTQRASGGTWSTLVSHVPV